MEIQIDRLNDGFLMEATNDSGNTIKMDASEAIGGTNKGFRPMQLLLAGLGGCSAIDVINILKKQRQPLEDIKILVTGERDNETIPSLFKEAHIHFKLFGTIDKEKAEKAVSLSVEKYCSVAKTLEKSARVTFSVEIINN